MTRGPGSLIHRIGGFVVHPQTVGIVGPVVRGGDVIPSIDCTGQGRHAIGVETIPVVVPDHQFYVV